MDEHEVDMQQAEDNSDQVDETTRAFQMPGIDSEPEDFMELTSPKSQGPAVSMVDSKAVKRPEDGRDIIVDIKEQPTQALYIPVEDSEVAYKSRRNQVTKPSS